MKYYTYIKGLGFMLGVLLLTACNSGEEVPEEDKSTTEETEESSVEEAPEEEDSAAEETEEGAAEEEEVMEETPEPEPLITEDDLFNDESIQALVNKQHFLSEDYMPEDLVPVEVPTVLENPEVNQLREAASTALTEMFAAAEEDGIILYARSGFRSYNTQMSLYNNYKAAHGEEAADRFSAQPGASEHQTGLAMDVTSESANLELLESFGETSEGTWVRENAHDFGFIIRYPEDSEEITGYLYEPWHLRYMGETLAADVYNSGLTYEEYIMESGIDIEEN